MIYEDVLRAIIIRCFTFAKCVLILGIDCVQCNVQNYLFLVMFVCHDKFYIQQSVVVSRMLVPFYAFDLKTEVKQSIG